MYMLKDRVEARLNAVLAKKKSGDANTRSQFLSMLMKITSGDLGKRLASTAVGGDTEGFKKAWDTVTEQMLLKVSEKADSGK